MNNLRNCKSIDKGWQERNWNKFSITLFALVVCLALILILAPGKSAAQTAALQSTQSSPVVLIALPWDDPTIRIPPPHQFRTVHAPTATFQINYLSQGTPDGQGATCLAWSPSAQAAFSYAASIWGRLINSPVPIRINACWANLGDPRILGYAWSNRARDFTNAPWPGTWYVHSLANALAGTDLDPTNPDFYTTYNSGFSWYFGTDGNTPSGQHDFVSVVMHEIAHGLNFAGSMRYGSNCGGSNYGCWGYGGYPNIYDRFIENGAGQALLNTTLFPNPSTALGSQLTSNNLYFNGINANAANSGARVKIYAPSTWAPGSSYSHLDYDTFKNTPNRLMVYAISSGSSIHDPGPVGMGVLKDLGWTTPSPLQNKVYLPLTLRDYSPPPLPGIPTLNAISNLDGDGNYDVTWSTASHASTYILEEDDNSSFSSPTTVYNGTGTSWSASGKLVGTYYYRVKARNTTGDSGWSGTQSVTVSTTLTWVTLVNTDFEGDFPGPWRAYDTDGSTNGEYYWGKRSCRAFAGSYSGWAVGAGANGAGLSCGSNYPNNALSVMEYGPFSLVGATAADLKFKLWLNTESGYDYVCRLASINGTDFYGSCTSGASGGWIDRTLDLANVPTLGNLLGQPQVWVMLLFYSDSSITYAEGAYVDNIVLRRCPSGATCPPGASVALPAGSRMIEFPFHITLPKK